MFYVIIALHARKVVPGGSFVSVIENECSKISITYFPVPTLALKDFVLSKLNKPPISISLTMDQSQRPLHLFPGGSVMEKKHRDILRRKRVQLVDDLEPKQLLNYLLQEEALTDNDAETIKVEPTRSSQAEKLLDILPRRGPKAFGVFCDALESSVGQRHLVLLLKGNISVDSSGDDLQYLVSVRVFSKRVNVTIGGSNADTACTGIYVNCVLFEFFFCSTI